MEKTQVKIALVMLLIVIGAYYVLKIPGKISLSLNNTAITDDFDYYDSQIQTLAKSLKGSTTKDTINNIIKYTVENVKYSSDISIDYCYNEKASTVLQTKTGDCVSMSRLNTALLRANGIQARTVGGCLSATNRCSAMFATVLYAEPKSVVIKPGDTKKRGFLHEWVEVYDGSQWLVIESTSGQVFQLNCNMYLQYGYDSNPRDRCTISDNSFVGKCMSY